MLAAAFRVCQLEKRTIISRCLCVGSTTPPFKPPETTLGGLADEDGAEKSEVLPPPSKVGGFAKAFQKQMEELEIMSKPSGPQQYTFASLLRNSKFIDLGDPKGKIVIGEIVNVVENDLYIDFGWKFQCVCVKPKKNANEFIVGTKVRLMINDLELSTRFLGSDTDLTLLEADCKLLNVIYTPVRK